MLRRTFLSLSLGAAALVSATVQPTLAADKLNMIDFTVLNDGATIADRTAYETKLDPIAARYGAERAYSYDIMGHIAGPLKDVVRVNVWAFEDPKALAKVNEDSDYKAMVPERDRINDLEKLTLYMAKVIKDEGPITEGVILVDLVAAKDGTGQAERDAYEAKMAPIAKKYGFEVVQSFEITGKIAGTGPDKPLRLNFWKGSDPAGLQKLTEDADYKALDDERNAITDFDNLALLLARPREN